VRAVEVVVTDKDGKVVYRTGYNLDLYEEYLKRKTNDLTTLWGIRAFGATLAPTGVSGSTLFSFTDTTGTARTQNIKVNAGSAYIFLNTNYCNNRLWIGYGSSSTPPSRSDYKLGSKLGEGLAGVTADETQGTVTISASFTMTAGTTVYEVGLEWEGTVAGCTTCGRFLVDRTVFPDGIRISAGQTLTVIYRLIL